MISWPLLEEGLWAGLFAASLGLFLTAPPRYAVGTFFCGFVGRVARDLLLGRGFTPGWSTAIAAALVVLVAVAVLRGHRVSPVLLITGILPLGAAVTVFHAIVGVLGLGSLKGEALSAATVTLAANLASIFASTLAIAVGLAAGIAIVRLVTRTESGEGV